MVHCCVLGCKNRSERKHETFHSFPKDINIRKLWIESTGRESWEPTKYTRMCSRHFKPQCFRKTKNFTYLYENSTPTLHTPGLRPSYTLQAMQSNMHRTTEKSADRLEQLPAPWEEAGPESVPVDEAEMEDEVPKVCRLCLASGVRMFDVAAGGLQDTFERVTGAELYTNDERPRQVCFVCCSQLQRFLAFCQMSRKAETYMTKLLKKGLQITEQEVSKRHRSIKPKLHVTKNPIIVIHTLQDDNECAIVEVKVEVKNEVEGKNISDSETESETEIGSEVKTETHINEKDPERENETEESLPDLDTEKEIKIETHINEKDPERENETEESLPDLDTEKEIKIEIDEIDIEEFDPFEAVEHTTVRGESSYCLQCAEVFASQSELLKHVRNHAKGT